MTIQEFAEQNRVRVRRDSCGEEIIPGRPRNATRQEDRSHIYQHSDDGKLFGLCYVQPLPYPSSVGKYRNAQKRLLAAGFTQQQNGDAEGIFLFDPTNDEQAKIALREAGIRINRPLSPERREKLLAAGRSTQIKAWRPAQNEALAPLETRDAR